MLGLVGLLFLITNMAPLFLAGLIDADFNGTLGPTNPWMIAITSVCSIPVLALLAYLAWLDQKFGFRSLIQQFCLYLF